MCFPDWPQMWCELSWLRWIIRINCWLSAHPFVLALCRMAQAQSSRVVHKNISVFYGNRPLERNTCKTVLLVGTTCWHDYLRNFYTDCIRTLFESTPIEYKVFIDLSLLVFDVIAWNWALHCISVLCCVTTCLWSKVWPATNFDSHKGENVADHQWIRYKGIVDERF